jgi:hypothetical protein
VVWSYQAEIFPLRIRAKATGISTMTNWGFNAVIGFLFPIVFKQLQDAVFFIFAGFCFIMFVWAWIFIPETAGKTYVVFT